MTESYACVGLARGRIVKVRVSYRPHAPSVAPGALPTDLMQGFAAATGFATTPPVGGAGAKG